MKGEQLFSTFETSGMSVFINSKDYIDKSFEDIDDHMQTCISSTSDAKTLSRE